MFVMAFLSTMMLLSVCVCVLHGYLWEIPTVSNSRDWHSGLTLYVNKAMFINSKG